MSGTEIAVAFASSIAGAILGALLPLFLPGKNGKNSIAGGTFMGDVHVGDSRVTVREDNRVVIDSVTVNQVVADSSRSRDSSASRPTPATGGDNNDAAGQVAAFLGIGVLILMAYLRYRLEIVAVVISLGAFAMFMPLGALLAARIRSVSFGRAQVMRIWVNVLLALGSLAGVWLLSNPTFGISRPVLAAILEAGRTESFSWMTQQFGWQWPLFVGYQILGLAASVVAMTMIALHSVKLYATTSTAVRLGANGSYRPGAVRSWLMSFLGSPGSVFTRAVVFTIMSLVLISGAGYALVTHLQPETVVPGTSAPAAPTSTSAESPGPTPAPPVTGTPTP